jgi:uncharacterized protein YkwD
MYRIRNRRVAAVVAALLIGVTTASVAGAGTAPTREASLLAPAAECPGAGRSGTPSGEQLPQMACLVAYVRAHAGLRQVGESPVLDRAAMLKVAADLRCRALTHTPCGQPFETAFEAAGYPQASASYGENLAFGQDSLGSPRRIMQAWLDSPPHRENLLTPEWRSFGLGVRTGVKFLGHRNISLWSLEFGSR